MAARFPSSVATQLQLLTAQNNSMVVLDADVDLDDDVITVDDASALPTSGYLTFVDTDEVIYYTAKTSNTLTGVTRGADNTSAIAHLAGVDLEQRWNADYHNIITLELVAVEQNLSDRIGLSATQLLVPSGAVGAPSYSHAADTGTGMYFSASNVTDFASNGTRVATFNSSLQFLVYKTTNQIVLGTTNTITISSTAPASSRTYTIPDAGGAANFLLSGWAQIVNADISASAAIAQSKLSLSITDTQVNASAAIAHSKMAALTISRALVSDASGFVTVATTTATEIGYVNGVTSAIQTQLNAKQATGNYITALTGDVSASGPGSASATISAATVTGKAITGFTSGSGTVGATDTILQAIQKLDGNDGLKLALAGGSVTGDITMTNQKAIIFREATGGGTDSVTVKAASAIATSWTLILPAAGPSANLQVLRVKDYTTGELEFGTGGGSGGINYLSTNPDAEAGTTGWAAYADAAATTPVDGTGGSPSETITRTTSSPLRGTGMFTITKGATNRQGDGVSYDFTIDAADKATIIQISFDYQVSSAFVAGDSSDVRMFIYDVTNAILITPTPYTIQGGTGGPRKFVSTFQTASNSTSYRLIFHTATTNASAWTMDFDNVIVGPQKSAWGAPISDWTSFTPTGSWVANSTYAGKWRRVGDSMEIYYHVAVSGAPTSTDLVFNLPSGYTIDSAKLNGTIGAFGAAVINDSGTRVYVGAAGYYSTTAVAIFQTESGDFGSVNATNPQTWANGDTCEAMVTVPILGWGSNVQMSNDTDTRVVAARYTQTSGQSITGATTINWDTKDYDTHGAVTTGASWKFTVPVSGKYRVSVKGRLASVAIAAVGNTALSCMLTKNGVDTAFLDNVIAQTTTAIAWPFGGSAVLDCVPGDTLAVYVSPGVNTTMSTNAALNHIEIERLSGPTSIAASERIACRYTTATSQSLSNNTDTWPDFGTKDYDTHGAVTAGVGVQTTETSAWKFTAPRSGVYLLSCTLTLSASPTANTGEFSITAFVNGANKGYLSYWTQRVATTTANLLTISGSGMFFLNAGDRINVKAYQFSGGALNVGANGAVLNHISIASIS